MKKPIFWVVITLTIKNYIKKITTHKDLEVYKIAYSLQQKIFEISKTFPREEIYCLTSQIRNSSRSVPANIAEAFRKRRYEKALVAILSDAEAEAAETQHWIDCSKDCKYIDESSHAYLFSNYDIVIGKIVRMITNSGSWTL